MIDNTQPPLSGTIDPAHFRKLVHAGSIRWAGNRKLKIYGRLDCPSGKRMKKINRVFFSSEEQAVQLGFRPCARCLQKDYSKWKLDRTIFSLSCSHVHDHHCSDAASVVALNT